MERSKTVAIIGGGPVGLAAAAHVLERGLTPIVLEAGPAIGHAMRQWSHVQLFSPWEYNVDKAAERLLAPTGWNSPESDAVPHRWRVVVAVSRALGFAHGAEGSYSHVEPRDRHQPRRF